MAGFRMCERCRAEYDDPRDRRFHAQPNACAACGPSVRLLDRGGDAVAGDALAEAARALRDGRILAVKGLGGYHLACRADDEAAVGALRARKHREDRPFALMVADVATARALVELAPPEEALLRSPERPIVLAPRRDGEAVAATVAPRVPELGLMLPYTPLHHMLLADTGPALVMTSGNVSDEPIAFRDEDALARLGAIADLFLVHDRPIQTRTDDSVIRVAAGRPLLLRRSRGYVPAAVPLPAPVARPTLGCGAELKNAICLARGDRAWPGHHIGDLKNLETLGSFREAIERLGRLLAVTPEVVAHDLHPDYLSTAWAREQEGLQLVGVQHHHAHLAACLAEHGEGGDAVGAIYDGTGLGTDGTVWGGELLVGGAAGFRRAGHLHAVRLPGGDQAIRQPWRMACAWLVEALGPDARPLATVAPDRWAAVARMAQTGLAAPLTTSVGRLFDAVAALCGLRVEVTYEGQAAIELEALAEPRERAAYPLPLSGSDPLILDARETVRWAVADLGAGASPRIVAARFHAGVAAATAEACARLAEAAGLDLVALSGGVFQNRLLLERTAADLRRRGLRVLVPERLPPNDGGIAYGQVAVAAATMP
jgi:hydrogenase maturation protein HypF